MKEENFRSNLVQVLAGIIQFKKNVKRFVVNVKLIFLCGNGNQLSLKKY